MISCRHCGKPCRRGNGGLCIACGKAKHAAGHGSSEYRKNADLVRRQARALLSCNVPLFCGICKQPLTSAADLTIDHIIKVRDGGTHEPGNLRPAHASCNYGDH
jgi:5-methylcytosine-specific restriction endonuclease McrA